MRFYHWWYDGPVDLISGTLMWMLENPLESVLLLLVFAALIKSYVESDGGRLKEKTSRDAFPKGVDGEAF